MVRISMPKTCQKKNKVEVNLKDTGVSQSEKLQPDAHIPRVEFCEPKNK